MEGTQYPARLHCHAPAHARFRNKAEPEYAWSPPRPNRRCDLPDDVADFETTLRREDREMLGGLGCPGTASCSLRTQVLLWKQSRRRSLLLPAAHPALDMKSKRVRLPSTLPGPRRD